MSPFMRWHSCVAFPPVVKTCVMGGSIEDAREIVGNRVDDACVGGPFDGARSKHVPKSDMLLEEKRAAHIVFDKRMAG